jgi:putative transposase
MNEHRHQYAIPTLYRVLQAARAGFYQWLHKPVSDREKENGRLLGLIRDSYAASRGVYGARRAFADLPEAGESCGKPRVAGLMRTYKIKGFRGYKTPRAIKGRPSVIAPNRLKRVFTVDTPNKAWVTDITYIRTWQGWLYLAVVLDLYARKVVGWSMKPTPGKELALDALLMAVWSRKPKTRVIVHSD